MTQLQISILVFDDAEELDFVGPYEVFTMANEVARHRNRDEPFRVELLSPDGGDVTCAKGMRVGAHGAFEDLSSTDIICIPGGRGTRKLVKDRDFAAKVADIAPGCRWVTSVCTGAFLLAAAGLTKDRSLTTHWAAFDEFASLGLEGNLQSGVRYVRDGNLLTAAGVSAGIDMALWLTGELLGPQVARETQKAMEYDPRPPYAEAD